VPKKPKQSVLGAAAEDLKKKGLHRPGKRTVEVFKTGLIAFDKGFGGGLVRGKIYEIAGRESTGKTTLCTEIAKQIQRQLKKAVVYLDFEHSYDVAYAAAMGLEVDDPDAFIFDQPNSLEDGLKVGRRLIETGKVGAVVVDSVAGMSPKSEIKVNKKGEESSAPAQQAQAFGPEIRKYISLLANTNTIGLFVNQTRVKFATWGKSGTTTPGGSALKFFASGRMMLFCRRSKVHPEDGKRTKICIWKNKTLGGVCQDSEYEIRPMMGILREEELLEIAQNAGIITDKQGYYTLAGKKFRGREKILEVLRDERVRKWILDQ